jgi:hypothetical protein
MTGCDPTSLLEKTDNNETKQDIQVTEEEFEVVELLEDEFAMNTIVVGLRANGKYRRIINCPKRNNMSNPMRQE